ncbi:MAG: hypothetical protein K5683_11500 [Prevotella sp.]|nr:hypothetical protein [Prevotella sp.]
MKRIFTLLISALALVATAGAQTVDQTFVFTDTLGNVVPDGTEIVVNAINAEGQMVVPLKVKNVAGVKAAVSMYENIDQKPVINDEYGKVADFSTCAFGNCMLIAETGYSSKSIVEDDYDMNIQTEWLPQQGQYATWTATLQIHLFDIVKKTVFGRTIENPGSEVIAYGPKVTVKFVYDAQSAHIGNMTTEDAEPQQYYNVRGQHIMAPAKGLNIVKLSNGKTIKRIF